MSSAKIRSFLASAVIILNPACDAVPPEPFPTFGTHFMVARLLTNGDVDTDFARNGFVALEFGGYQSEAHGVGVDGQRRIVVAGQASDGGVPQFATARLHESGRPDHRFGAGDGRLRTRYPGNLSSTASAVAVSRVDGALTTGFVAVGTNHPPGAQRFALAGFDEDGLDRGFGTNGLVQTDFPAAADGNARDVVIDVRGRIVAAGENSRRVLLARYSADGRLDPAFGSGGRIVGSLPGTIEAVPTTVAIDRSGRIVVGGRAVDSMRGFRFALARYDDRGRLDTTFGTRGVSLLNVGTDEPVWVSDIAILPDGKIVAVGGALFLRADGTSFLRPVIARFNPDGTPDTTFRPRGYLYPTIGAAATGLELSSVVADQAGRFTVAGAAGFSGEGRIVLFRYLPDGALDPVFGINGTKTVPFPVTAFVHPSDMTLDRFERIVIAGRVSFSP